MIRLVDYQEKLVKIAAQQISHWCSESVEELFVDYLTNLY